MTRGRSLGSGQTSVDKIDRDILDILQKDSTVTVADIGEIVGVSATPSWRRIQRMEDLGIIQKRVAILDPDKVGAGTTVFVSICAEMHSDKWRQRFVETVERLPEVVEVYRTSGKIDYVLKLAVPDLSAYDHFCRKISSQVEVRSVSSMFAMDRIKETTELPLGYVSSKTRRTDKSG